MQQDQFSKENNPNKKLLKLNVDFTHRLVDGNHCLVDSHCLMADQTLGILHALAMQFERGESRLSDELLYNLIDAAIAGVNDLKALVRAHGGQL
jgi:hypothetical protein